MTLEFTVEHDHTVFVDEGEEQLIGNIYFTVQTRPGDFQVRDSGAPTPRTISLPRRTAYLGPDGHLYKDETSGEPFRLVANDPAFNLDHITYRADFDLTTLIGESIPVRHCFFPAPSTDTTLYLTRAMVDPDQIVMSVRAKCFAEDILDGGTLGAVLITLNTAAEIRAALGIDLIDLEEWKWYANFAAFPVSGVTTAVYGDLATGALWRWNGSIYTPATQDMALRTHLATSKTTPVDADELPLVDSEASNVLKKLTVANLKANLDARYPLLRAVLHHDFSDKSNGAPSTTMDTGQVATPFTLSSTLGTPDAWAVLSGKVGFAAYGTTTATSDGVNHALYWPVNLGVNVTRVKVPVTWPAASVGGSQFTIVLPSATWDSGHLPAAGVHFGASGNGQWHCSKWNGSSEDAHYMDDAMYGRFAAQNTGVEGVFEFIIDRDASTLQVFFPDGSSTPPVYNSAVSAYTGTRVIFELFVSSAVNDIPPSFGQFVADTEALPFDTPVVTLPRVAQLAKASSIGVTATPTSGGTTTLTSTSTSVQEFYGSANETVVAPSTSVQAGNSWEIVNASTGVITVNASGGGLMGALATGETARIEALAATPTAAGSWLTLLFLTRDGTQVIRNKTINLTSNTLTMTKAQLNTAVSDADVATLTGSETLTNKTLTAPAVTSPTGIVKGDVGLGNVDNTSNATERAASATLTNKTIDLASNTVTMTKAQLNTAVSDADVATLTGTEALTNKTLDDTNAATLMDTSLTIESAGATTKKANLIIPSAQTAATTRSHTLPTVDSTLAVQVKGSLPTTSGGAVQWGIPCNWLISSGTTGRTLNVVQYVPFRILYPVTITNYQFEVTTGPGSNGNFAFSIYAADSQMQPTGAPVYDSGSVSVASGFTGVKTGPGSLTITLQPGLYVLATNNDQTMTLRYASGPNPAVVAAMGASLFPISYFAVQTYGAFPNPGTKWTTTNNSGAGANFVVFFQWSE